jgi:hypothetical protein
VSTPYFDASANLPWSNVSGIGRHPSFLSSDLSEPTPATQRDSGSNPIARTERFPGYVVVDKNIPGGFPGSKPLPEVVANNDPPTPTPAPKKHVRFWGSPSSADKPAPVDQSTVGHPHC